MTQQKYAYYLFFIKLGHLAIGLEIFNQALISL